tara:strand:- start:13 stop:774 length:762 start_codon:yes stop_codon:yes gene_type:complete
MDLPLFHSVSQHVVDIHSGNTHVWVITSSDLRSTDVCDRHESILSEGEKTRMRSFRSVHKRHQFVIARAALRIILSHCMPGSRPEDMVFTTNEYGKPALASNPLSLQFNVSHSKNYIAVGVVAQRSIGVDIEYMSSKRDIHKIASHYYHSNEWNAQLLAACACDNDIHHRFYTLWVLKEALIKAQGNGLSVPISDYWFSLADLAAPQLHGPDSAESRWQFTCRYIDGDVSLAVARERIAAPGTDSLVMHYVSI